MGCAPSIGSPTVIKPVEHIEANNNLIFTIDERLKLKEVWVIVKQNNLKKLGDDIVTRALEKNSSLISYWQNISFIDQRSNLTFAENESIIETDLLCKQCYKQHGYTILDKIDQLIMIMVTRGTTTNSNDSILDEYFHRIGEKHVQYKIKQDHVDILCECLIECLKNLMYHNRNEWTIKHELTWMKFFTLITNQFLSPTSTKSVS
ncbi:unnamed protein product [Rotaria magnacalcarata]|uniref:Globin domain-containing protein n=4 Tax=Rotaria magnacalcarata TaxID=392030 RepID=A0A816RTC5_9BILA|nr:unnamed protein product [Rotaria magnacalcarata]CAF2075112.1 unnamed protein product [Rotaria magnacalcarata]CAF2092149.1 unnamed protein product [Rotaria magnacalcarata]CAF2222197.1 unnamed protein product [Rotaria magnacalcarata]CAF3894891.1 unnamed protein product [Rotaria magnacalcarata]